MAEAIPFILISLFSTAATILAKDDVEPLAPPDPQDAVDRATESAKKVRASRVNAFERSEQLGPIQLQAPTLKI